MKLVKVAKKLALVGTVIAVGLWIFSYFVGMELVLWGNGQTAFGEISHDRVISAGFSEGQLVGDYSAIEAKHTRLLGRKWELRGYFFQPQYLSLDLAHTKQWIGIVVGWQFDRTSDVQAYLFWGIRIPLAFMALSMGAPALLSVWRWGTRTIGAIHRSNWIIRGTKTIARVNTIRRKLARGAVILMAGVCATACFLTVIFGF